MFTFEEIIKTFICQILNNIKFKVSECYFIVLKLFIYYFPLKI